MGTPIKEIKEDYSRYEELLNQIKNSTAKQIVLDGIKPNRVDTRIKKVETIHSTRTERIILIVESKIINKKDFEFKLRAPEFIAPPFFRFDSDGVAHYNRIPNVELPKQKVETPHFHGFNSEGRNYAYKTPALSNESSCHALLNDISLCMAHFSDESQTYYNKDGYIEIVQTPPSEIDFGIDQENPTSGLEYE